MPENAAVFNIFQLAPEVTPGTALAATDIIRDFGVRFVPVAPSTPIQPAGNIFRTGHLYGKEHAEGQIDGGLGYQSLPYLLSSLLHTHTPSTPSSGGAYTLTLGAASAGTFTLTFNGSTTAGIAYNANAAAVDAALELLSTIGTGNVTVTGSDLPGGTQTITFTGPLANTPLALTGSGAGLTGGGLVLTAVATASAARRWLYTPAQSAPETAFQTYTVEQGSSVTASRIAHAQVNSLEINWTQESVTIGGTMLGQRMTDNFGSLAASPTEVLVQPAHAPHISVWMGNTYNGMTRMSRPLEARLAINNRVGPVFTLNDQHTSFAALVQLPVEVVLSLTVEHDTDSDDFLTDMRAGTVKYMMVEAVGPTIETGYPYRIRFTMPCQLTNPGRTDNQGVHAATWDLAAVYRDNVVGAADFALQAEVINSLAAL
jgi:hypothetical protein